MIDNIVPYCLFCSGEHNLDPRTGSHRVAPSGAAGCRRRCVRSLRLSQDLDGGSGPRRRGVAAGTMYLHPAAACARHRAGFRSFTTPPSPPSASNPPSFPSCRRWTAAARQDPSACANWRRRWSWIARRSGTTSNPWNGTIWWFCASRPTIGASVTSGVTNKGRTILQRSRRLWRQAEGRFEAIFGKEPAAELRAVLLSIAGNEELNSLPIH